MEGGTLDSLVADGPAVVIIDRDRSVRFVDVSPDWLVRTESHLILEALGQVRLAAAA